MKPKELLFPVSTAVLLALAFPSLSLWPLAFVGLVPLLFWTSGKTYRQAFWGGTLAGLIFYGITFAWFASLTYWVGGIVLLGVMLLVIFFALFWGLIAAGKCFFEKWLPAGVAVAVPAVWVVMEYIQNHIFTGFGWGSLGYTQWNNLLVAQLASLGSVYAVSLFVVMVNVLVYEFLRNVRRMRFALLAAGGLAALGVGVPLWGGMQMRKPDMSSSLTVGVIQPNFSLDVKWNAEYAEHTLAIQEKLTELVAAKGAKLVVWPESALYGYLVDEVDQIGDFVRPNKIYLLIGSNHYERRGSDIDDEPLYFNSAFLVSPDGRILGRYDKRHLAPFGEYVPLANVLGFLGKVVPLISDFTPGKDNKLFDIEGKKFGVLICFENSFPHLVRKSARLGSDFLIQITNDGWFGHTAQPGQDLALAVFRAIENGVTLIRGTNTGISCFIDPWGRISGTVVAPWGETVFVRGISVETVSTVPHNTFYKSFGDVWALGCVVVSGAILGMCFQLRLVKSKSAAKTKHEGKRKRNPSK